MIKIVSRILLFFSFLALFSGAAPTGAASGLASLPGVLHPEFQISDDSIPNADHYHPAVAYNPTHKEFLVVWHSSRSGLRDVYAQRLSLNGELIGPTLAITNDGVSSQPSVAYNPLDGGDEYLVVWMKDVSGNGSQYEIWGRIIPWNGLGSNPGFRVFSWANRTFWSPKVAFNWRAYQKPGEYFVIWNAFDSNTGQPTDIAGVHVSASGAPDSLPHIITYEGQQIAPGVRMSVPHQADLVFNDYPSYGEYFVVWRGKTTGISDTGIYGIPVYPDGGRKGSVLFIGSKGGPNGDVQYPAVATGYDNGYLVVWQQRDDTTSPWYIQGRTYDLNGVPHSVPGLKLQDPAGAQTRPTAVEGREAGSYLIFRQAIFTGGEGIRANYCITGQNTMALQCDEPTMIEEAVFWNAANPVVVASLHHSLPDDPENSRPSYLIVYEGDSAGDPTVHRRIYGRMLSPEKAGTITLIRSSLNPSVVGESVTFTATVTSGGGTPTGSVTFKEDSATLGVRALSGGIATFTTSSLGAGVHMIYAEYGGDDYFYGSNSSPLAQIVNDSAPYPLRLFAPVILR